MATKFTYRREYLLAYKRHFYKSVSLSVHNWNQCKISYLCFLGFIRDRPEEGSPCNPDIECKVDGYCKDYNWCEPDPRVPEVSGVPRTGRTIYGKCDRASAPHNLYFDTQTRQCNYFYNLNKDLQEIYNQDLDCKKTLRCEWTSDGDCSSTYNFYDPVLHPQSVQTRTCPKRKNGDSEHDRLIWDPTRRNCFLCHQVRLESNPVYFCCSEKHHQYNINDVKLPSPLNPVMTILPKEYGGTADNTYVPG
jgi:hypothetical protein